MNSKQVNVLEFTEKYGQEWRYGTPFLPGAETLLLRSRLISEEAAEFIAACSTKDMVGIADALVDILYVTYGAAVACGIDLEPIFDEVHRSNMTKTPSLDAGGKVTKGPDYSPPDVEGELVKQGWHKIHGVSDGME